LVFAALVFAAAVVVVCHAVVFWVLVLLRMPSGRYGTGSRDAAPWLISAFDHAASQSTRQVHLRAAGEKNVLNLGLDSASAGRDLKDTLAMRGLRLWSPAGCCSLWA
jgi:hypothetical protein